MIPYDIARPLLVNRIYRQTSNIWLTLVRFKIVDHSDVVGASPVGAVGNKIVDHSNLVGA